jgi:hypothetical protein
MHLSNIITRDFLLIVSHRSFVEMIAYGICYRAGGARVTWNEEENMLWPVTPSAAMAYHDSLLYDFQKQRVVQVTRAAKRRLRDRLFVHLAGFLISAGLWLQARYQPVVYSGPEACQPSL